MGKGLQKDTTVTAYADDLAIWRTTTFRRPSHLEDHHSQTASHLEDHHIQTASHLEDHHSQTASHLEATTFRRPAIWRTTTFRRPNKNGPRQKSALKIFQDEVNAIVRSLRDSGFVLSAQETVFMSVLLKGVSSPDNLQIDVEGTPIKGSHSVRYLRVTFQCNGHWTKQADRAIANARKALSLLRAVRRESWGQERKTLVHLSLSLVRSRLLFGSQALFSLPPSQIQRLAAVEC